MKERTVRRSLALGGVFALCTTLLAPTSHAATHVAASGPSGEVVWALPADPNAIKASQKQADLFHQMHPAITIKILQIPNNQNYDVKVQTLIAGGAAPDLFGSGDVVLPTLFQKGYARDLTPYINRDHYDMSDFFQQEFRAFRYKGDVYALTDNWDTQVMYYNKDLFRKAGVAFPNNNWTWSDFRNAAIKLTQGSGPNKQYGAVFTSWFAPVEDLIWSYGGDIFTPDGKSTLLNQPPAEQAIQWLADLYTKDKISPTPAMVQSSGPDLRFMSGRAAMLVDGGRWWASEFVGPPGITKFDWAAAPLPKGPKGRANFFHIGCSVIARNAKNPDAAWEFLKFLVSKQGIAIVAADEQGIPARTSLARDPSFINDPINIKHDLVQPWFDSLPTVHAAPMIINFSQAQSLIDSALDPVWRGRTTAKAAMDALAPKLNAELRSTK